MRISFVFITFASLLAPWHAVKGASSCAKCGHIYSSDAMKRLIEIDLSSGVSKQIGTLSTQATDVALTAGGNFYYIAYSAPSFPLFEYDMCTYAETEQVGLGGFTNGLCGLPNSEVLVGQQSKLKKIDLTDHSVKEIGAGAWCGNSAGDMVYNPTDHIFYSAKGCHGHCGWGDALVQVDPTTGDQVGDIVGCFKLDGQNTRVWGLALDDTGRIIAGNESSDLFLVNPETAELTRIPITGDYAGTWGLASFPCPPASSDTQHLTFNRFTNEVGLTDSDVTVDLSFLLNSKTDEIQDLIIDGHDLSLTKSSSVIDLSHLDNKHDLRVDHTTLSLGASDVDLSSLAQDLSLADDVLEISDGAPVTGARVGLSSMRVTSLQASIDNIDGKDLHAGRKLRQKNPSFLRILADGEEGPLVEYGGNARSGFTMIRKGRVIGFTITVKDKLKPGSGFLDISLKKCNDMDSPLDFAIGGGEAMNFGPNDGWSKSLEYTTPILLGAGDAICFETVRQGDVESEGGGDNVASLVLTLEQ